MTIVAPPGAFSCASSVDGQNARIRWLGWYCDPLRRSAPAFIFSSGSESQQAQTPIKKRHVGATTKLVRPAPKVIVEKWAHPVPKVIL
jgi:hypothetical protein